MSYKVRLVATRGRKTLGKKLQRAGVDPEGIRIIEQKADHTTLRIDGVSAPAANIIKQQLLSVDGQ